MTSIQNKFSSNPIVKHIHPQLLIFKTLNFDIKLMYILSLVGIFGNNEIDHHAKSATSFFTVCQFTVYSGPKKSFHSNRAFKMAEPLVYKNP